MSPVRDGPDTMLTARGIISAPARSLRSNANASSMPATMRGAALPTGGFTPELERARAEGVPTFTHFLDLPILFLIVALGVIRPDSWVLFAVGAVAAVSIAAFLTYYIPRLYPWGDPS